MVYVVWYCLGLEVKVAVLEKNGDMSSIYIYTEFLKDIHVVKLSLFKYTSCRRREEKQLFVY